MKILEKKMKKSIVALVIAGIVGLTGCSSDNKTEDLKNNLQPEGSVQVDSQNQTNTEDNISNDDTKNLRKDKWTFVAYSTKTGASGYVNLNSIEQVQSEKPNVDYLRVTTKVIFRNNPNHSIYTREEFDCSGRSRTLSMEIYDGDDLIKSYPNDNKNDKLNKEFNVWDVVNPDSYSGSVENTICNK